MSETMVLDPLRADEVPVWQKERIKKLTCEIKQLLDKLPKEPLSHAQFLEKLRCSEQEYILCVRSTLKRSEVMLKRGVSEGRSTAYNPQILNLWKANMDIQFVLDPYACVMYIINYVGKSQRGMSKLLRQALADSRKGNNSIRKNSK